MVWIYAGITRELKQQNQKIEILDTYWLYAISVAISMKRPVGNFMNEH